MALHSASPEKGDALDTLHRLMPSLRLDGRWIFSARLDAPWRYDFAPYDGPSLHIAMHGMLEAGLVDPAETVSMMPGEMLVVRVGRAAWLADSAESQRQLPPNAGGEGCHLGDSPVPPGGDPTHRVLCGLLRPEGGRGHPLLDALPPRFRLRYADDPVLASLVEVLDGTLQRGECAALINGRVAELLYLRALERALGEDAGSAARPLVVDPRLLTLLEAVRNRLDEAWTLDRAAALIAVSRSTLARLFRAELGTSFLNHVNTQRMVRARESLIGSSLSIEQIAAQLGFASRESFSRAYRRFHGHSPGVERQSGE